MRRDSFWTPARGMFISYGILMILGTVLLAMPWAAQGERLTFMEALFTATSAVTVTGLIVVDSASHFTRAGQWVLLGLIQLGGLGILTFTTWIMLMAGQSLGSFARGASSGTFGSLQGWSMRWVLHGVLALALLIEAVGAGLLFLSWRSELGTGEAAFQAMFHSVSAFCNAGFSTFEDGLIRFRGDGFVTGLMALLIVLGGLGFIVLIDLMRRLHPRIRQRRLSLHARVVLHMSLWLIVVGTAGLLVLEWGARSSGGAGLGPMDALFHSISARTAGFNTVPMASLTSPALFFIILLMLVGASPGSTGGGLKTTTTAILAAMVRSQVRGRRSAEMLGRRLPTQEVARALATAAMYATTLVVGLLALLFVQGPGHTDFLPLAFEAVSALGTVGLSMGATGELNEAGRLVVVVLMLCGRLGPITILLTWVGRPHGGHYEYAKESVMTG